MCIILFIYVFNIFSTSAYLLVTELSHYEKAEQVDNVLIRLFFCTFGKPGVGDSERSERQ